MTALPRLKRQCQFCCIQTKTFSFQNNFDGMCILYADFEKGDGKYKFMMTSSSKVNCNFPVYMSVFACIFYGLALGSYNAYAVRKSTANRNIGYVLTVLVIQTYLEIIYIYFFLNLYMQSLTTIRVYKANVRKYR